MIGWDRAPEALKLEFETEKDLIHGLTDTPDLSFNNVKGIGNVSGFALEMMFLGTILKSKLEQGDYKVVVSRCLNVLIAGMTNITKQVTGDTEINIDIKFTSILPNNIAEIVNTLMTASGGKAIISQETAVKTNPLVANADEEMKLLGSEADIVSQNTLFNPTNP